MTQAIHEGRLATADEALRALWRQMAMPQAALAQLALSGSEPVFPSSFAVGTAAQTSLAAAALAAAEIHHLRGGARQRVSVDMLHAAQECRSYFRIDGVERDIHDKITGVYRCRDDRWVRIHANFAHHRDGALRLLGCPTGPATSKDEVARALITRDAFEFEQAATDAGLVVAAMRTFEEWDAHPQGMALAAQPLLTITKIGEADPLPWPRGGPRERPLHGIRVLDLTRIIAGPVCGRALAAYGADVMLVNAPHLPNIDTIAETSRGKLSVQVNLRSEQGQETMRGLLADARVFVQGYRPGALEGLGFGAASASRLRPGLVYVTLSAYGDRGPWSARRGFDSLVQTATGFNHAEGQAAGLNAPKPLPMQILDHASGYLMAFGAQAALARQAEQGGSWHVRVSLGQTGRWLRGLGRVQGGLACAMPPLEDYLETTPSGYGDLTAVRHAARFAVTPAAWTRPSMPPGSHPPAWPASGA